MASTKHLKISSPKLIPNSKNILLRYKDSKLSNVQKSASDIDLKKLREYHERTDHRQSSQGKELNNESGNLSSSVPGINSTILRSKSEQPAQANDSTNHRRTMYDEGDYVIINFHTVQSEDNQLSQGKSEAQETTRNLSTNAKIDKDSNDLKDLSNHNSTYMFDSCSHSLLPGASGSNVDECGYEVPIALQAPIYLSIDANASSVVAPERPPPSPPTNTRPPMPHGSSLLLTTEDKSVCKPESKNKSPKAQRHNWRKEAVRGKKQSESDSSQSKESQSNNKVSHEHSELASPPKPITSFLSSRLGQGGMKLDSSEGEKHRSMTSSSYTLSSSFTDQDSECELEDDWDDSDFSSDDCDSYYQLVDPPNLSGHTSDHDYQIIDDSIAHNPSKKKVKRSKSMKKVMNFVNGRTKSSESNKSETSSKSPNLHRQNLQNMKSSSSGSTWETVSTPGILKLSNYKDLRKACGDNSSDIT